MKTIELIGKIARTALECLLCLLGVSGFAVLGAGNADGGPSWLSLAGLAALIVSYKGLERLGFLEGDEEV